MNWFTNCSIIILLITQTSFSQVNIEKHRTEADSTGFTSSLSVEASVRSGNVDLQEYSIENRNDFILQSSLLFLILNGTLGWESGEQISEDALVHLRYIRNINNPINLEIFTQYNHSEPRRLDARFLVGGGIRFKMFSNEKMKFWYGSSYMFEFEKINSINDNEVYTHRWSNYISLAKSFNENVQAGLVNYIQPAFDNFKDYRNLTEINLSANIFNDISFTIDFSIHYDSQPPTNVKKTDVIMESGFVFFFQ